MTLTAEIERAEKVLNKALDEEKVLNFALEGLPNLQNRMQAPNNALQQIDQGDAAALLMNQNESNITSIAGVIKADDIAGSLAELCRGERKGRATDGEITVFKAVGNALSDIAAAGLVYRDFSAMA